MANGRSDRIACPLPHLTSQMTGDGIRKTGPMRHWCPAAGSRAHFSTSAQDAVCELLYARSCTVGSRCHAFALRIRCDPSQAHATTLMTYSHPLSVPLRIILILIVCTYITSPPPPPHTLHPHCPHSSHIPCPPSASCTVYAIGLSLLFTRMSCTGCRINASNRNASSKLTASDLCEIRMTEAGSQTRLEEALRHKL